MKLDYLILFLALLVTAVGLLQSCGSSKNQLNPGATIPIYEISINDFHDQFPNLPQSNACTHTHDGKIEIYITATERKEAVRQVLHEFMHAHAQVVLASNIKFSSREDELRYTLSMLSGKDFDTTTCGPRK